MVFESTADTQTPQQRPEGRPSSGSGGGTARALTYAGAILFAAIAIAGIVYLSRFEVEEMRTLARQFMETARGEPWALPFVCLVYILGGFVFFPVMAMNLATSMVFGPVYGFLYALAGAMSNLLVFFWLGRMGRHHALGQFLSRPPFKKADDVIQKGGLTGVVTVHIVPFGPFVLCNILAGLSSIGLATYALGTFLALLPGGIARSILGDSLMKVFLEPSLETSLYVALGGVLWLAVMVAMHYALKRLQAKKAPPAQNQG